MTLAHQQITREWWQRHRANFDLHVSELVLYESGRGDPDAVHARLELIADLPVTSVTPEIRVDCPDTLKFDLVKRVQARFVERAKSRPARRDAGPAIREVVTIDGVRVVFDDGWGLIRASNTQPALVLRFEASSPERLAAIRTLIESELEESRRAFAR